MFVIALVVALLSQVPESTSSIIGDNRSCPTWLYQTEEGRCASGSSLLNVIFCNNISQQVSIHNSFCLTSLDQDHNEAVVGRCLYIQSHQQYIDRVYIEVDKNISRQDQQFCGYLNREGRLCGHCQHNHSISAYSYDLKCYQCHRGLFSNIILYLVVAYVPLTIFLAIVVVLHVSVTSPRLNVAIMVCQAYSQPVGLRVLTQVTRKKGYFAFVQFFATVYGIWNLDFFRTLIPPIFLPLTTIQVIALDYLVAVYPLLLLVCVYVLVWAHDRGCRLVVRMWRPFLRCSARIRQQWNARHSIIDAFATFILLSYVKFISTSGDLIIPTKLYNIHGSRIGHFMYYDATVEFMGPQHMPYAILALAVLVLGVMFPLFLLLYPMNWFQVLLNKCHLNSPGLRIFMECFQGYYRDRSDGGWECRYFSAVYPSLRITGTIVYAATLTNIYFPLQVLIVTVVVLTTLLIRPYKKQFKLYNTIDIVFLLSVMVLSTSLTIPSFTFDWDELPPECGFVLGGIMSLVPLFYLVGLSFKEIVRVCSRLFSHHLKPITLTWKFTAEDTENHEQHAELDPLIQTIP